MNEQKQEPLQIKLSHNSKGNLSLLKLKLPLNLTINLGSIRWMQTLISFHNLELVTNELVKTRFLHVGIETPVIKEIRLTSVQTLCFVNRTRNLVHGLIKDNRFFGCSFLNDSRFLLNWDECLRFVKISIQSNDQDLQEESYNHLSRELVVSQCLSHIGGHICLHPSVEEDQVDCNE